MNLNTKKIGKIFPSDKLLIIVFISFILFKIFGGNIIVEWILAILFTLSFIILIVKSIYFVLSQNENKQEQGRSNKEAKKSKV
jgi:glucan phosphoethanolaminetransferase (alkaline phosphatase superfamily)